MLGKLLWVILVLVYILFIWARSAQDAASSTNESMLITQYFIMLVDTMGLEITITEADHIVRKAAHMGEYFVLALLLVKTSRVLSIKWKKALGYILFLALAVAVLDEYIQLWFHGRAGSIEDIFIDFAGAVMGILSGKLIIMFMNYVGRLTAKAEE